MPPPMTTHADPYFDLPDWRVSRKGNWWCDHHGIRATVFLRFEGEDAGRWAIVVDGSFWPATYADEVEALNLAERLIEVRLNRRQRQAEREHRRASEEQPFRGIVRQLPSQILSDNQL